MTDVGFRIQCIQSVLIINTVLSSVISKDVYFLSH